MFFSTQMFGQRINEVTFKQGDETFTISESQDTIVLSKKPFSIVYFGKQYNESKKEFNSARIAVLDSDENTEDLTIGQRTKHIPFFEPGSGYAATNENEEIIISNSGHHYLYYENENEKRVNLISRNSDLLELEWKIFAVYSYQNEKTIPLSDIEISSLKFVIFIDRNTNQRIDVDELKIVTVNFK
ncbi:MAG: hypothetical protein C4K58_05600 [Flavobacteriaceae bacterium]|nr:MAG: hypothetical protein C4K58_05600 [Flavobacteriaceae bacterium]